MRLALAIDPPLLASMLQRILESDGREVVVVPPGADTTGEWFDVVITSGRTPPGVDGKAFIRLPDPLNRSTTGTVRRNGDVEIIQIPDPAALVTLVDGLTGHRV